GQVVGGRGARVRRRGGGSLFVRRLLAERLPARVAESRAGRVRRAALWTDRRVDQRRCALGAKPCALTILVTARWTVHNPAMVSVLLHSNQIAASRRPRT